MGFERSRNSTRTFFFGTISKLIGIVGPLVTRTIIVNKLGSEYLGMSSLFTSVLTILNVSELGIGSAITFCLYRPISEKDTRSINALLGLLRKQYRCIGLIILGVGVAVMSFLPHMISGGYPADINIYVLYLIYLANAVISYLGFAYKGILFNAYQRGDVTHRIQSLIEILKYALQVVLLLLFHNYYLFVLMLPLSTIIITVLTELRSRKMYPNLLPEGKVEPEVKQTIKQKVLVMSAHSLFASLTNTIDNLVISGSMGLVTLAVYGNYNYIFSAVYGFVVIAYRSLTPVIGNVLCSDDADKSTSIFSGLYFLTTWGITWVCTCLLCLFQPFITVWIGESFLLEWPVVILIVAFFFANALRQFFGTYVAAAGLWNKTLPRQIEMSVSNLVLDILLVKKYGVGGIVFASFFTTYILCLPMDAYVTYKYIIKEPVKNGLLRIAQTTAVLVFVCGVTYGICRVIVLPAFATLVLRAVLCLIVPNALFCAFFHKTAEFEFAATRMKKLLQRVVK